MDYINWGNQYFDEAKKLNNYISKLKSKLNKCSSTEKRDLNRRIFMFYEIMYELRCTGKRLKEGDMCEWSSYKH